MTSTRLSELATAETDRAARISASTDSVAVTTDGLPAAGKQAGIRTVNTDPCPGVLSTVTVPPSNSQ